MGILVQDVDDQFSTDFKVVTEIQPTEQQEKHFYLLKEW